jgi:hypothetical protein
MKKYLSLKTGLMLLAALVCITLTFVFQDPSGLVMAYFPFTAVTHTGGKNVAGSQILAYFCPIASITAEPSLADDPSSLAEILYLSGNFTCAASSNFVELYLTYKTGGYKAEPAGDLDGEGFKITAELFHPGSADAIAGFAAKCTNTPGILILVEENGERLVMGSTKHPCYLRGSFDLGKNPDDRKGFAFTAETYSGQQITRFNGAIPISGGSVPAIS